MTLLVGDTLQVAKHILKKQRECIVRLLCALHNTIKHPGVSESYNQFDIFLDK